MIARFLLLAVAIPLIYNPMLAASTMPRVIVSTDIGGSDPDDFQSMVHYLVCADMFRTEGLISSPPHTGRAAHILECLDAYAADFGKLSTWSENYPGPNVLRAMTRQGETEAQAGDIPDAAGNPGVDLIIERCLADEPGPVWVLVWGSITDVAKAVHAEPAIKKKLRIYSIGSWNTRMDEKARAYLFNNHPDLWWIECDTTFRGMYMGGEQAGEFGNVEFVERNIAGHGHLGDLFVSKKRDIKMGDTPSVLYLLQGDANDPESAHWGGAFVRPFPDERPTYWHDNPDPSLIVNNRKGAVTVNRWRKEFLLDWKARMDRLVSKRESCHSSSSE